MKTNIVLIGLSGAGKTTIGKHLSAALDMPFTDSDENIEKTYGRISDLFLKGEEYFRDLESKMILSLSSLDGVIISTGGGVVIRPANMEALKKKGVIFYISRSVEDILKSLDTNNRPLLKKNPESLYRLYDERDPLYGEYCDYRVDSTDMKNAIRTIKAIWAKIS